jgi:hypothetical protein
MVVCTDVPKGGPVLCVMLETTCVGGVYVMCVAWELLGVPEDVWTPGVSLTPLVGHLDIVVRWNDVD